MVNTTTTTSDDIEVAREAVHELPPVAAPKSPKDADPFLVAFEEPYDDDNPFDWSAGRKWMATDVLSATGFNRIMVSTIMAPALGTIATELNMNATEAAMSLSIFLLATAFGPLVMGPLSEVYGRQAVLHGSSVWFLAWNLACGLAKTKEALIASRFMAGFGGSAIYSLGAGVLGDIWRPDQRGKTLGIYLLIPILGSAVGPIIGGFMAGRTTWRWMFWSTSIFQAVMLAVTMVTFPETYGPVILRRRAAKLRKETRDPRYYTADERRDGKRSAARVIARALGRPCRLLLLHPIIQLTSIMSGFGYGTLYVVLSTYSTLWTDQYNQSVEISGLHYITCALGEIIGAQIMGWLMDRYYKRQVRANSAPEDRLPLMLPAIAIGWGGMLVYGWLAERRLHWALVDAAVIFMMLGQQMAGMPGTAYVIDTYAEHTSSAMAAQQFVRSLTAFLFPLFAPSMYSTLGYGWGNTVMGISGILVLGLPTWYLYRRGSHYRSKAHSVY